MKSEHRFAMVLCTFLALVSCEAAAGGELNEAGLMVRDGVWDGGVGTYFLPFEGTSSTWPVDGWYSLTIRADRIERARVRTPAGAMPPFLRDIANQAEGSAGSAQNARSGDGSSPRYVRIPGVRIPEGPTPAYRFKNGTTSIVPMLDYRYELSLGGASFALTVRNGQRSKTGVPYGEGAYYTIEYGGNRYEYWLGDYGWDSRIDAIADIDGDGKPDFLITGAGNNRWYEYLILSSTAKPGRNAPTASLQGMGC